MSKNIQQIYNANPITSNLAGDLMYFGHSGADAAMLFSDFSAQFGVPYTPASLTKTDDTNVTLALGGTPATALLQSVSLTLGWTGTLSPTRGGTGVNNGTSTITIGGNVTFSGAFTFAGTITGNTNVTFPTSGTLATTSQLPTPAALTKTDDTNVTLSLGGTPATALLQATSLTLGWTGTLSGTRGGTGVNNGASTATYAGNLNFAEAFSTSGAFAVTQTYTGITNVTFPTTGTLATTSQLPSAAALTKTDDTNVTLTLGGTPATSLLQATSLTLGWTGTLSGTRGGTGVNNGSSTITIGGNVAFSGAFTFTGTITGNTNVTFPTTGTLATTSQLLSSPLTTKGDIWGYSTTNARIPVGADYQLPGADSTASLGVSYDYPNFPLTKSSIVQVFEASGGNAATADNAPVNTQVSGTGAQILLGLGATDGTTFGVAIPETGSTTTGRAYWCGSGAQLYTAGGQVIFEADCKIPTLSNGTDRFAVSIGLTSSIGSGKFPDGAYFYYRDDVNSGNWQCEIALFGSSGTPHITTTSTPAGTSWTRFKIICDPTCSTVTFYINDVQVASDSTAANLPKGVALKTACGLLKSAGTNSLTLQVDYMKLRKDFTTAR